jgi:mRNA interferase MazF
VHEPEHEPQAGEVWYVDFDPQVEREQGGVRPALVISSDYFNLAPNGLHYLVPITSRDRNLRYHIRVNPPEGGLTRPSVMMCDQAKAQSARRLLEKRGEVTRETLKRVQWMVADCIDVYR